MDYNLAHLIDWDEVDADEVQEAHDAIQALSEVVVAAGESVVSDELTVVFYKWVKPYEKHNLGERILSDHSRIGDIRTGFEDEYSRCEVCGNIGKTTPDCYGCYSELLLLVDNYYAQYWCQDCIDANIEDFDEWYREAIWSTGDAKVHYGLPEHAEKLGYVRIAEGFQSGLHEGMNDTPKDMVNVAVEMHLPIAFYVMPSQFYAQWDVYAKVPESLIERTREVLGIVDSHRYDRQIETSTPLWYALVPKGPRGYGVDNLTEVRTLGNNEDWKALREKYAHILGPCMTKEGALCYATPSSEEPTNGWEADMIAAGVDFMKWM